MTLTPEQFAKLTAQLTSNSAPTPSPSPNYGSQVAEAAAGGVEKIKSGLNLAATAPSSTAVDETAFNVPLGVTRAGSGIAQTALSPIAPFLTSISEGFKKLTDYISNTKPLQEYGEGLADTSAPTGAEMLLEGTSNVADIAGLVGGGRSAPTVTKTAVTDVAAGVGNTAKRVATATTNVAKDIVPSRQGMINHQVSRALDLTPGDLNNIARSTGNDVGTWLSEKNLIGKNKAQTQSNVDSFFKDNYKLVRDEISKVKTIYKPTAIPRFYDALKQIQQQIENVPGLEKAAVEVDNLLNKTELTLADVQRAKELLDEHFSLYKVTGDVAQGAAREGLSNIRSELRGFIEQQVKDATGADIADLNNSVATARSISDAITTRAPRGLTRSNLKLGDLGVFGIGSMYGTPLFGLALLFAKKVIESPTIRLRVARYLDKQGDANKARLTAQLEAGTVPKELDQLLESGK